jgi:hypothetical protein
VVQPLCGEITGSGNSNGPRPDGAREAFVPPANGVDSAPWRTSILAPRQGANVDILRFPVVLPPATISTSLRDDRVGTKARNAHQFHSHPLQASDLRREEVRRIVEETIPPEEKEQFMSTAEMLKEEGRVEGRQVLCESVLDLLETRFDAVPPSVRESLLEVEDLAQLRSLVRRAGLCSSVEEFAQGL